MARVPDDLDDEIRALYAGDPTAFVAGRTALAKANKERAAEIKALRKPEKRAWMLDKAVAEDPKAAKALADAADAVGAAQEKGGDLRAATIAMRDAVRALAGRTPDPATATGDLVAVVADPASLDLLLAGRLVEVPEGGGFGPLPTGPLPERAPPEPEPDPEEERRRKEAAAALVKAEKARDKAAAALEKAEAARDRAATALEEAEAAVDEARSRV
jgi:hypothetical protein